LFNFVFFSLFFFSTSKRRKNEKDTCLPFFPSRSLFSVTRDEADAALCVLKFQNRSFKKCTSETGQRWAVFGKEFRKTQFFVCSSSAGLKSGKRNRLPLREKEPHAALRPPYPPKGIKIVKTSTPSAVPRKSTRERRRKGGARARARCRGCKHASTIPPFERHRSASRSPGVRIVCELRRPVGERL